MMGMTKALRKSGVFSVAAIGLLCLACDATSTGSTASSAGVTGSDGTGDDGSDSGGSGATAGTVDLDDANMVDDLEDGDDAIIEQNERGGSWFQYNDETEGATQMPRPHRVLRSDRRRPRRQRLFRADLR